MDLFPGTKYRVLTENERMCLTATEMDTPFWNFQDSRVSELYRYVCLYRSTIFNEKNEIVSQLENIVYENKGKNLYVIKDLRILKTMTYDWFNEMINTEDSSYYMKVYNKYYDMYKQIKSKLKGGYYNENNYWKNRGL